MHVPPYPVRTHVQDRLERQNEQLNMEIRRLKMEKEQVSSTNVPASWSQQPREPITPPRMLQPEQGSGGIWLTPDTCKRTPNGTRVPDGPPPPDSPAPPPLPAWPISDYEVADEPPRKFRGVMGDQRYHVPERWSMETSPRDSRTRALETEIEQLKDFIQNHPMYAKSLPTYFTTPFQTAEDRTREVSALRRNLGMPRVDELGRASTYRHDLGEESQQVRAFGSSGMQVLGGDQQQGRAFGSSGKHALGGEPLQARAAHDLSSRHELGGVCHPDRAGVDDVWHQDRAQRGRSPCRAAVMEDADLKAVPITLPNLPSPEGKDASLDAGDWLIQLEPLIGDFRWDIRSQHYCLSTLRFW